MIRNPTSIRLSAAISGMFMALSQSSAEQIYFNDFNGPPGSKYPEWSSSTISYSCPMTPTLSGVLPAPIVTNCVSPNRAQIFLGEFGGPPVAAPGEPCFNHFRVDQTVTLTLTNLPAHQSLTVAFDLLILKSWDGNSPTYGPDRWQLRVGTNAPLVDTTFSNNPKVQTEGSYQDSPKAGALQWTGAASTNTLGYKFFGDTTYHFEFTFAHFEPTFALHFSSSLFEGKGSADESWGLDNVRVSSTAK